MGLNAYFSCVVVKKPGVDWHVALGAVMIFGLVFFLLTAAGIRQMIVNAIPAELWRSQLFATMRIPSTEC